MREVARHVALHFPLLGAGLIFFLEGFGIPIPVEFPLGIIGWRINRGLNTYWEMVALMFFFSLIGNVAGYGIGYYGGRPLALRLTRWLGVRDETWARIEAWFHKYGLLLVVGTRWINWGFAQNMMLSGITRVPFGRFMVVLVINDFLWAMAWVWVAIKAMIQLQRGMSLLHDYQVQLGWIALVLAASGIATWLYWWLFKRSKP